MNILFLAHRVPFPPDKGDKIRSFNILRQLAKRHNVSLMCITKNRDDIRYAGRLKEWCRSVDIVPISNLRRKIITPWYLFSNRPLTLPYFFSGELKAILNERLRKEAFDLIFIFSSCMAQYVLDKESICKVMDFIDVDSDKWKQYADYSRFPLNLIYRRESATLQSFEKEVAKKVDFCTVTSEKEAALFKSFIPDIKIAAIPNGVESLKELYYQPEPGQLVFVGAMDYFPNVDAMTYFTSEILPKIQETCPEVKLIIVGSNPDQAVRKLGMSKGIKVTGYVSDVNKYLAQARVCVIPLRIARGVQNKILEAMSMGVPVVTTSTALEGIEAQPERDVFVADTPAEFARKTIALLTDDNLHKKLSQNGQRLVQENYRWEDQVTKLEKIFTQVICK